MSGRSWLSALSGLMTDIAAIVLPRHCVVCQRTLQAGERHFCNRCYRALPMTRLHGERGNVVESLFWEKIPIVRANAFLHYHSGSAGARPVVRLKYFDAPKLGVTLGRIMARDLADTDFFEGVDILLPLPLSSQRQRQRGYNQSQELARGISEVTGLPIDTTSVVRTVDNPSQTHFDARQRHENVAGIFSLLRPEALAGRHILLIDDVLTTGASLLSCAREIEKAGDVRFSVLTLYLAGHHPMVPNRPKGQENLPGR